MKELEHRIDKFGIRHVIDNIIEICHLKAEHTRYIYDENDANADRWENLAIQLNRLEDLPN